MIAGLDGIRAIAFLLVFSIHTGFLSFGWVGVQLFFVLSGFLITGILLDMKDYLPQKEYYKRFYGRRLLRIFPLYYFYLLLMTGVTTWLERIPYRPNRMQVFQDQAPYAALYVYNIFYAGANFEYTAFLEHFWSLSVEEQFYIIWPLLIFLVPKKNIKTLFLGSIFVGLGFRIIFTILYKLYPMPFLRENMAIALYALPLTHLDAFGFGAYITRYKFTAPKKQLLILFFIVPALGFMAQYYATGTFTHDITGLGYPFAMPKAMQYIWGYSILNYFFALFIYTVVHEKIFVKFLELPWLKYLGKISYGLYVYHFAIIWFVGRFIIDKLDLPISYDEAAGIQAILSLMVSIMIASFSYYFIEQPLLGLKERFFKVKERTPDIFTGQVIRNKNDG
ncbi:MAG: acyltransferase [Chloroflexi bacterium]|nr:acyltransferase [Chloroflexota bacterium]